MSEKWIAAGAVGIGGIAAVAYVGYQYFVGPGQAILGEYKLMLRDIYDETKKFITDNSKLSPPIIGLQPWQEALLEEKKKILTILQPEVIKVLEQSKIDPQAWFQQLVIMIVELGVAAIVVGAIVALVKSWWSKSASQNLQSANSHSHLMFEICMREFAELGQLDLAGGLNTSIEAFYYTYTAVDLVNAASVYSLKLSTFTPGTIDYLVYSQLLTFVQTEMSVTAGIMAQMYPFWSPF